MDQLCVSVSLNVQLAYHGNENVLKKCPSNETNATDDAFFYLKMAFGAIFQPHWSLGNPPRMLSAFPLVLYVSQDHEYIKKKLKLQYPTVTARLHAEINEKITISIKWKNFQS